MSTEPQEIANNFKRRRETMTCKKHKTTYEGWVFHTGGQWRPVPCPDCKIALGVTTRALTNHMLEKEKEERERIRLEATRIPVKYLDKTTYNYKAETEEQRRAVATITTYRDRHTENQNNSAGLILAGNPGTGKTHLACAIGIDLCKKGRSVEFWTVSALFKRIRESYSQGNGKTEQQAIDYFANMDMLIIDEIGVQKGSDSEENLLFDVINARYNLMKPTILITNLEPTAIRKTIGGRVIDRLKEGGGKFVDFNWGSYRSQVVEPTKTVKQLTYYEAYTDAQKQLYARENGQDEWQEKAVYWAAHEMGIERTKEFKFFEVRDEWCAMLDKHRAESSEKEVPGIV